LGAVAAYFRFFANRTFQTRLDIAPSVKAVPYHEKTYLVQFTVKVTNGGTVKLGARRTLPGPEEAQSRWGEDLPYACGLEVCALADDVSALEWVTWFEPGTNRPGRQLRRLAPTLNLLAEYMESDEVGEDRECDFWMEPGETYDLTAARVLVPGLYAGKVTFLGERSGFPWSLKQSYGEHSDDGEFWSEVFLFRVPETDEGGRAPLSIVSESQTVIVASTG
jgi:hypothetical protein